MAVQIVSMVMFNGFRLVVLLTTVFGISVIYWNTSTWKPTIDVDEEHFTIRTFTRPLPVSSQEFSIDTPGCKIPLLNPFHPSIKQFIKISSRPDLVCNKVPSIITVNRNRIKLSPTVQKTLPVDKCEFSPVKRNGDNTIITRKPILMNLMDEINITDEFIKVECFKSKYPVYEDFLPFILRKPDVEKRVGEALKKLPVSSDHRLSVLILGLDSVPKNQYGRLLRRTNEFIRKTLPFIEFRSYHKVGLNTFPNMLPFLTGNTQKEFNMDFSKGDMNSLPLVWKEFSKRGYRTLFAEDAPNIAMFNYLKKGFKNPPTDYYLRPFSLAVEKSSMMKKSKTGCFNSRTETSVILKYIVDLFDEFVEDPVFAFAFFSRITHDDYNGAERQDNPVETTLNSLYKKGHLNRTIVFFISDHGFRYGPVRMTYTGHTEEKLPFNFMLIPAWFSSKYPQLYANLKTNEKRLVTPFDMHRTLIDIATNFENLTEYKWNDRSVSLFTPVSEMRNCESAGIGSQFCTCIERQQVDLDEPIVTKTANILLAYVNSLTDKHRDLCSVFKLIKIVEVTSQKMLMNDNVGQVNEGYAINYQLTLQVNPGGEVFQGIVWYNGKIESYHVEPYVDRITRYGNQSHCVDTFELKPFCYCNV